MTKVQSLSVFSVAASLLTLAPRLPAAATECGVKHTRLTAPFTGQWRGQDELYDIAQGKSCRESRNCSISGMARVIFPSICSSG